MYIHEQMVSPDFNNVCSTVDEEWTNFPLTDIAESPMLRLLNIISFTVIKGKTIGMERKTALETILHWIQTVDSSTSLHQIQWQI